ncbi:MAG TPA: hypothetical protein VIN40_01750 [Candidatus Tyrphobacter sp.]
MSRNDDLIFDGISENGKLVKVRVLRDTIGNRAAPASEIRNLEESYEHPKPGDVFEAPFDPRYVGLYRFRSLRTGTIAFTPIRPAYGRGSGTFSYDARENVVAYSYAPSVLPPHASAGSVQDRRTQVLPNYWAVTLERQTYRGRYGLWSGGASVQITVSAFGRLRRKTLGTASNPPVPPRTSSTLRSQRYYVAPSSLLVSTKHSGPIRTP